MKYIRLRGELKSEEQIQLNSFLGSTIRGAIISGISKAYCIKKI